MPRGKLASHLLDRVACLTTEEHIAIESKQTIKSFPSRLVEKKWRLALFFMHSRMMLKDCNNFSSQNLVKIPELILHGCASSCCEIPVMLQRERDVLPTDCRVLEHPLHFRTAEIISGAAGKVCFLFMLDEVS